MSRATKLIVIVACGVFVVVISAVAIAQGFPPQLPMGPNAGAGFHGPGYGMPMMPPAPTQPVMQVHRESLYILQGNVLYKINLTLFRQVSTLQLVPPPPVYPFGRPEAQSSNQPQ